MAHGQDTISLIMSSKPEMPSSAHLCSAIQTSLQTSLGLPGPSLVQYLQKLLTNHRDWYRQQQFQDIFAKNLGIDVLEASDSLGSTPGEGCRNLLQPYVNEEGTADGSQPSGLFMTIVLLVRSFGLFLIAYMLYLIGCAVQILVWVIPGCMRMDCKVLHPERQRWPGVGGEFFPGLYSSSTISTKHTS